MQRINSNNLRQLFQSVYYNLTPKVVADIYGKHEIDEYISVKFEKAETDFPAWFCELDNETSKRCIEILLNI